MRRNERQFQVLRFGLNHNVTRNNGLKVFFDRFIGQMLWTTLHFHQFYFIIIIFLHFPKNIICVLENNKKEREARCSKTSKITITKFHSIVLSLSSSFKIQFASFVKIIIKISFAIQVFMDVNEINVGKFVRNGKYF